MRRTAVDYLAPFHQQDFFCDKLDIRNNVGCDYDYLVESYLCHQISYTDTLLRVKTCGRLVEDNDFRFAEHSLCDEGTLFHTARKAAEAFVSAVLQVDKVD